MPYTSFVQLRHDPGLTPCQPIVSTTELVHIQWYVCKVTLHVVTKVITVHANSVTLGTLAIKHMCVQSRADVDTLVSIV